MNQEEVHIEEIQELVKFVFSDNRHNNRMVIESSDFKDNRDLYFFCLELTMKGLSYLYGDENGKVDIEDLTLEQLENVKTKLSNAAIELTVDIVPLDDNIETLLNRIEVYKKNTFPIVNYYEKKGLLSKVNGMNSIEKVSDQIKDIIS